MSDNPYHVVVDCASGLVTTIQLSDEETAARAKADEATNAAKADKHSAHAAAVQAILESKDPAVQALAKILGI